jgi:hypothetical protein
MRAVSTGADGAAVLLLLALACGCSGSSNGATVDAGSDGAPGPCNTLANNGPIVTIVNQAGSPPAPQGGSIADGTYYLTDLSVFTGADAGAGSTGELVKKTIQIAGSTEQSIVHSGLGTVITTDTLGVTGVNIADLQTCPSNRTTQVTFTANGGTLVVYSVDSKGFTEAETFTKQ